MVDRKAYILLWHEEEFGGWGAEDHVSVHRCLDDAEEYKKSFLERLSRVADRYGCSEPYSEFVGPDTWDRLNSSFGIEEKGILFNDIHPNSLREVYKK